MVLAHIIDIWTAGDVVTIPDLARRMGIDKAGLHFHLTALRDDGLITWEPHKMGTIRPAFAVMPVNT